MKKQLIILWIAISCVTLISTWGLVWLRAQHENANRESKQETYESVVELEFNQKASEFYSDLYSRILTFFDAFLLLAATTIFLNVDENVRKNKWNRFLSFFMCPCIAMTAIFLFMNADGGDGFEATYPSLVPYFVCLTIAYIWFSRWLKRNSAMTTN
jgi:hypothetical protein